MFLTFYNPQDEPPGITVLFKIQCKKIYINGDRLYIDSRWYALFRDNKWRFMDILEFGEDGFDVDNPVNPIPDTFKFFTIEE